MLLQPNPKRYYKLEKISDRDRIQDYQKSDVVITYRKLGFPLRPPIFLVYFPAIRLMIHFQSQYLFGHWNQVVLKQTGRQVFSST